jgi:hypothetical protein
MPGSAVRKELHAGNAAGPLVIVLAVCPKKKGELQM